jgi:hypothetical protein
VGRCPLVVVALHAALLCACMGTGQAAVAQDVTAPGAFLGRPVGADFELADWSEVSGYHRLLGEESPRVSVEVIGQSTKGRDFLLTVVSSEENMARLDEIRAVSARLADPRGLADAEVPGLLARGRPVLFVSLGMHSNETAAPQFGMELAHRLAMSDAEPYRSAREQLVVVIAPCLNPDGMDEIVAWYRQTVGGPYEAADLLELYQEYAGHDNNRDWFMLSQAETRLVSEQLYSVWRPQVYWDVHQQGQRNERLFVPPFRDPLDPNLDPGVIAGIDALGSRALLDLTRAGLTGVSTGVTYDMWWNGGNRNVPVRHNIIGLLTEAASVNIASPVFMPRDTLRAPSGLDGYAPSNRFPAPWPGGWWRLRDIIDYEHAFAESLLGSLAREPQVWMRNTLEAARRSVAAGADGAPRAWILPADNRDPDAVRRLADSLLLTGVELHVATEPLSADGRRWPAGSLVIRRDQPYGQHVKDLFEVQRYPDGDPPYDVAGWTLPLLMGVHRVEVVGEIEGALRRVSGADEAVAAFAPLTEAERESGPLDSARGDSWRAVIARLADGGHASFATSGAEAGSFRLSGGQGSLAGAPGAGSAPGAGDEGDTALTVSRLPRIGLYAPWSGSMDEGWMRWVLDTWELPYVRVRNEMLRAGGLSDLLDVLILPGVGARQLDDGRAHGSVPAAYSGGLDPEGAVAVEEFVRGGGTLVAVEDSCAWAIELFGLPLEDVTRTEAGRGFACPGSVLRAVPADAPLAAGLPASLAVFFSRSAAFRVEAESGGGLEPEVLLRYAGARLLLSGWIREEQVIEGQAAWVRVGVGKGRVHLFGFRPQYRSWSQGVFQLLFRTLLLEPAG